MPDPEEPGEIPERHDAEAEVYPELGERRSDSFIADRIAPLLRESTLWPVLTVIIASLAAFGAWALVLAVQEARLVGIAAAFGLFWLTGTAAVAEVRQTGRPGPLGVVIAITWLTTAVFFFAARHWGVV